MKEQRISIACGEPFKAEMDANILIRERREDGWYVVSLQSSSYHQMSYDRIIITLLFEREQPSP